MRHAIAIMALAALTACGVDGVPIRPGSQDELAPARNATPETSGQDWIGGTASVHTATTL